MPRKRTPFLSFKAKLARAVKKALADGVVIRPYDHYIDISTGRDMLTNKPCNCPLGALVGDTYPIEPITGLTDAQALAFLNGFDKGDAGRSAYGRLGAEYRQRFSGG